MLASIHPLGERARERRWGVTVGAYVVGVHGGRLPLLGALLAAPAPLLPLTPGATAVLVVAAGAARPGRSTWVAVPLPTIHRQVDEDWLDRYRGWVVGAGFGFQLGLGVVTIVTTAAVYLALPSPCSPARWSRAS